MGKGCPTVIIIGWTTDITPGLKNREANIFRVFSRWIHLFVTFARRRETFPPIHIDFKRRYVFFLRVQSLGNFNHVEQEKVWWSPRIWRGAVIPTSVHKGFPSTCTQGVAYSSTPRVYIRPLWQLEGTAKIYAYETSLIIYIDVVLDVHDCVRTAGGDQVPGYSGGWK